MSKYNMVAGEVNSEDRTKAPRFQELSFKNWKKFFMAFLMRHDRAHLAITEKDPETLITPEEEEELSQEDQTKMRKASQKWKNRNETAYSYLMEVYNAHERASTIAPLYEGGQAAI
jgi:hypothetical protein